MIRSKTGRWRPGNAYTALPESSNKSPEITSPRFGPKGPRHHGTRQHYGERARHGAGHRRLAAAREAQNRLADAAFHWRRAAELHATDPAGLLGLGAVYLKLNDKPAAAEVLKQLRAREWGASDTVPDPAGRVREFEAKVGPR